MPARTSQEAQQVAEAVRHVCLEAARDGYQDAATRGLCHEGAWEAALSAIRGASLSGILEQHAKVGRRGPHGALDGLLVRDVMTSEAVTLRPEDKLKIAQDVMRLGRIRHFPVVDDSGALCGVVSQRDLLRKALLGWGQDHSPSQDRLPSTIRISEVMTREVVSIEPDAPLRDAAAQMFPRKLGCLPVVEDGKVIGIVTEADFVRLAL